MLFEKAAEGTLNYKLLKGHMQSEESFLDVKEGLTMVVERVNFAYFFDRVLVRAIPGFECSVSVKYLLDPTFDVCNHNCPRSSRFMTVPVQCTPFHLPRGWDRPTISS